MPKLSIAVIPIAAFAVLKYIEEYLQLIFKIVLEAKAPATFEEP